VQRRTHRDANCPAIACVHGQGKGAPAASRLVENEGTRPGEPQWTSVEMSLRTVDGLGVRYIQTGVYELLTQPPVRMTSPDPQAP